MATLTQQIKRFALDQGYCRVGIAPADDFEDHIQELLSRGSLYDFYIEGPSKPLLGARPKVAWPAAKSIVVLAYDYVQCAFPATLIGKVARVYQSRSMNAQRHRIAGLRLQAVKEFIRSKGINIGPSMMLPERRLGMRAGISNIGRNNFAFVDGIGSFINLSAIVVDRVLEYDAPAPPICKCPRGCTACMDACPTRAIYAPFRLDPRRCINFNTSMTKEEIGFGVTDNIPPEIRKHMAQAIFGCDICQEVCPRNAKRLKMELPKDPLLEVISKSFSLVSVLHMKEDYFEEYVQPMTYNFGLEPRYLQRNAAVALGNSHDPMYLDDLGVELEHDDPMIRGHVAWAIGQIGTHKGIALLEARLARESDHGVRLEISQALESIASKPAD
ncbi:MAG: 4Fe-4S double cluster binding domain-containing protein [Bacillota bacterium]